MTEPQKIGSVPPWTLGWRLQRSLAHADMRAEEMAEELGVVRATISRWMHDRGGPPRPIYLKQWALRTGVPYDWLSTGEEPGGPTPATAGSGAGTPSWFSNRDQEGGWVVEPLADVVELRPTLEPLRAVS